MKGAYCLLIHIKADFEIKIGSLGRLKLARGHYVYIGSALNNLEKRITRHLKSKKTKHWHIDYLLANKNAAVQKIFIKESKTREECHIARKLATYGTPIRNFGSSDCRCKSHLFKITNDKINWPHLGMRTLPSQKS